MKYIKEYYKKTIMQQIKHLQLFKGTCTKTDKHSGCYVFPVGASKLKQPQPFPDFKKVEPPEPPAFSSFGPVSIIKTMCTCAN